MKCKIKFTSQFKKDFKRAMKRGLDEAKFPNILSSHRQLWLQF